MREQLNMTPAVSPVDAARAAFAAARSHPEFPTEDRRRHETREEQRAERRLTTAHLAALESLPVEPADEAVRARGEHLESLKPHALATLAQTAHGRTLIGAHVAAQAGAPYEEQLELAHRCALMRPEQALDLGLIAIRAEPAHHLTMGPDPYAELFAHMLDAGIRPEEIKSALSKREDPTDD
jgi:hypothetical protein